MTKRRYRLPMKAVAAALSIACFLSFAGVAVTHAVAADTWDTWPPKKPAPGAESPTSEAAAKAGEAAGTKTYAGLSAGTWGWIALGVGGLAAILLIAGGGGNGTSTAPTHTP
jgi:hypothetical protein